MIQPRVELQRILARGPDSLRNNLVVDISSIATWLRHCAPGTPAWSSTVWDELARVIGRSGRRVLWLQVLLQENSEAARIAERLREVAGETALVVQSGESLVSLIKGALHDGLEISVITAEADNRSQLHVLNWAVASVLDIATGKLWTCGPEEPATPLGEPHFLPLLDAITEPRPGDPKFRPWGGRRSIDDREKMDEILRSGPVLASPTIEPLLDPNAPLRRYTKQGIASNLAAIQQRAAELSGEGPVDDDARNAFGTWARNRLSIESEPLPPVLLGVVERDRAGDLRLQELCWTDGESIRRTRIETLAHHVLSTLARKPRRWVIPRALDLLGYMVDRGLEVPRSVVDPAMTAFALNPDNPGSVVDALASAKHIAPDLRRWLFDVERKTSAPAHTSELLSHLAAIDRELSERTRERGLVALLERDIGSTLPVLARVERAGAWVGAPPGGWEALRRRVEAELDTCEREFRGFIGKLDPYRARAYELVWALRRTLGKLPEGEWSSAMVSEPQLELRRQAKYHTSARALMRARTLIEALHWIELLRTAERARPIYTPQVSGRWSTSGINLQGILRRTEEGRAIRSALMGPPGSLLVGADFSGYEVRLLADLCSGPRLLEAAGKDDAIGHLAQLWFGATDEYHRELMKDCLHPLHYGQRRETFAAGIAHFPVADARILYDLLREDLPGIAALQAQVADALTSIGRVSTRGGWQRSWDSKTNPTERARRQAFSTLVQGLGADVLRWVLRELDRELRVVGARIVHQAHDEVLAAVEPENADQCVEIMREIMTKGVMERSGLIRSARIVIKGPKKGRTWADLA